MIEQRFRKALRDIMRAQRKIEYGVSCIAPASADATAEQGFRTVVEVLRPLIGGDGGEAVEERIVVLRAERVELRGRTWKRAGGLQPAELRERPQESVPGNLRS